MIMEHIHFFPGTLLPIALKIACFSLGQWGWCDWSYVLLYSALVSYQTQNQMDKLCKTTYAAWYQGRLVKFTASRKVDFRMLGNP
jgi:hypothetical protein